MGFSVYMSLHDYFFTAPNAIVDRPFVGLDNFSAVLTDGAVRQAFGNIAIFLAINVPLTVVVALGLATALNAVLPFRTFLRGAYYVPYVTASVALVGVWLFLFNSGGLVNSILGPLAPDPSWLVNQTLAMPMIARSTWTASWPRHSPDGPPRPTPQPVPTRSASARGPWRGLHFCLRCARKTRRLR